MKLYLSIGVLLALLLAVAAPAQSNERRDRQIRDLNEASSRLNRYSTNAVSTPEREFIHERVTELLNRARKSVSDNYLFGRLVAATDDFLDASQQIQDAFEDAPNREDTQERAARELENTYFDLMQGEHFARQSGDPHADEYIRISRRLYENARAAYEAEEYAKARDLGEAAREVVAGLEGLAQAAVRVPTPPRL
jgi:hypothetical protein